MTTKEITTKEVTTISKEVDILTKEVIAISKEVDILTKEITTKEVTTISKEVDILTKELQQRNKSLWCLATRCRKINSQAVNFTARTKEVSMTLQLKTLRSSTMSTFPIPSTPTRCRLSFLHFLFSRNFSQFSASPTS